MASALRPESTRQYGAKSPDEKKIETVSQAYRTISPYLIVSRASECITFLTRAFGAVERFRVPRGDAPDLIMHAEVSIGNGVIELADSNQQYEALWRPYEQVRAPAAARRSTAAGDQREPSQVKAAAPHPPAPQSIHLYVDDADATYEAAMEAGAGSIYAPVDQPWGDRWGVVRDPFGNLWHIATQITWTPGPEGIGNVQCYLHLKDAEKMIPFLRDAFGGILLGDVPKSPEGKVLHATVQIGDNTLEVSETYGEFQPMPCHIHLHVADCDALYARALAAGAAVVDPPSNKPYGRSGGVRDAFRNTWYITSPLKDVRS